MIKEIFLQSGFQASDEQEEKFEKYTELLLHYNEMFNLTAITEKNDIVIKHYLDSIFAMSILPQNSTVIDIGSGAGFPAIPLKIMRPDLKITALDSLKKRVEFIKTVINSLALTDIDSVHIRCEDAGRTEYRENFDAAVARAVAPLNVLCEYALPLVKPGGIFLAYKGGEPEEELTAAARAIKILGGRLVEVKKFSLPDGSHRSIIVIEKTAPTPAKYPRRGNKARKEAL